MSIRQIPLLIICMRHIKAKAWERRLKIVFVEIDCALEEQYRGRFELHPSRPAEGKTTNPEMDGLINVGASYSAGFGSRFGPGYVVDIRFSTLDQVSETIKQEVRDTVLEMLRNKLPRVFPEQELHVEKEKSHIRIYGDLSLD